MALASTLSELSNVKEIQILPNGKNPGIKPITSPAMILNKWSKFNKYVTCYNKVVDLTQKIRGNKPRVLKLVVIVGSDIVIKVTVKKTAIDMAQGGLLVEVKHLQIIHSKKGLLVAMLPKNTNLAYVKEHVQQCIIKGGHIQKLRRKQLPNGKGLE